jgi:hypothetical protein
MPKKKLTSWNLGGVSGEVKNKTRIAVTEPTRTQINHSCNHGQTTATVATENLKGLISIHKMLFENQGGLNI